MSTIFSYDAETNGLWGQAFSIGAIVANDKGEEIDRFVGRCPIEEDVNPWVAENVLPEMEDIKVTHSSYDELLKDFVDFWNKNKEDAQSLTHMGMVVESKLWRDAHDKGLIGDFDAPYITVDACSFPEIGDSVDTYCKNNNIEISKDEYLGGTHNPLYDSAVALKAYVDVMRERGRENQKDEIDTITHTDKEQLPEGKLSFEDWLKANKLNEEYDDQSYEKNENHPLRKVYEEYLKEPIPENKDVKDQAISTPVPEEI